jgi:chitodextrinase
VHRSGGAGAPRRRAWILRALAVLVVAAAVPLAGTSPTVPAPQLQLVSLTDPVPPTNVVAVSADRALTISWTASTEGSITGYRVYLDGALKASPTGPSASVTGLVNGQSYVVTVTTVTSFIGTWEGATGSSPVNGIPRDAVAPTAPAGVTAVRGDGRVDLSWTPNGGDYDANGYRVLRDGTAVTGVLLGRNTGSWADTAVTNDVTYSYTVQTHDTSGNWSASSAPAVLATPTDLTPPAVPTGIVGGRGDQRAGLGWNTNGETDVAGYVVFRDGNEIATVTVPEYLDLGLTNDHTYSYALLAVDTHGNRSARSAPVPITPTDLTPPGAPTGVVAVRGDGRVDLTWSANPEPDLADYRVMRDGVEVATVTGATGHTDLGLTNDATYRYTLAAVDTHGNHSISSSPVFATPTDLGAPAAPTGLAAVAGGGQVTLSWTANTEPDIAGYRVLRDGATVATVTGTAHTDTGLTDDTTYAYALVAVDTHGNTSPVSAGPSCPGRRTPSPTWPPTGCCATASRSPP